MSNKLQESDHQKNISEQFAGLDMKELIGSPLFAAYAGQLQLSKTTSEFIERMEIQASNDKK